MGDIIQNKELLSTASEKGES